MESSKMESQKLECKFCTKKSKGVVVPMSYSSVSKYNEHCKKEKHLVNSGVLKMNNCQACKKAFFSTKKQNEHYLTSRHLKNQEKFDSVNGKSRVRLVRDKTNIREELTIESSEVINTEGAAKSLCSSVPCTGCKDNEQTIKTYREALERSNKSTEESIALSTKKLTSENTQLRAKISELDSNVRFLSAQIKQQKTTTQSKQFKMINEEQELEIKELKNKLYKQGIAERNNIMKCSDLETTNLKLKYQIQRMTQQYEQSQMEAEDYRSQINNSTCSNSVESNCSKCAKLESEVVEYQQQVQTYINENEEYNRQKDELFEKVLEQVEQKVRAEVQANKTNTKTYPSRQDEMLLMELEDLRQQVKCTPAVAQHCTQCNCLNLQIKQTVVVDDKHQMGKNNMEHQATCFNPSFIIVENEEL